MKNFFQNCNNDADDDDNNNNNNNNNVFAAYFQLQEVRLLQIF